MKTSLYAVVVPLVLLCESSAQSQYDFTYTIVENNPSVVFTSEHLEILDEGLQSATQLWESVLLGHDAFDGPYEFPFDVRPVSASGLLATAGPVDVLAFDGKIIPTAGVLSVNTDRLVELSEGLLGLTSENLVDELFAHEIGHMLGIGGLWQVNGVYEPRSG